MVSPNEEPMTERDKYIETLENKLRKAGRAKRFIGSEDGAVLTEWVTEQVNTIARNLGGTKYLSNNDLANYDRGQLAMAQKILTMLNSEASTNTDEIKDKLIAAKTDE